MESFKSIPFEFQTRPLEEMSSRAQEFYELMRRRRSIRHFSSRPVPRQLIELAIKTAASAPSGANRQPWKFVAVSESALKKRIRIAAEREERLSYEGRMPADWLEVLQPFGTDWQKPYLETVPWIVVVFAVSYGFDDEGAKTKNYYVQESVGIACGLFISALHNMGLVTLTHTPSPMGFLAEILERPTNERPYLLFPIGYPDEKAEVPAVSRKVLDEITIWNE
jgi:nitroreductase